jgi:two-component system nitrate/nitrite response regulator NarL
MVSLSEVLWTSDVFSRVEEPVALEMEALRVLVVADDPLARVGLSQIIKDDPDCTLVGQIDRAIELSHALDVYRPDVLLWDLGWEASENVEQLAELSEEGLPVVALLSDESLALDALTSGVRGLLSRDSEPGMIKMALRSASQGLMVLDEQLSGTVLPQNRTPSYLIEALTEREKEVLELLAEGLTNKAIAVHLGISEFTVKFHVNAILNKLGAQSRTEAAIRAARLGLIKL